MEQTTLLNYAVGEIIPIYSDALNQKRPEGRARLLERLDTHPTKNKWALAQWSVHFVDSKGRDIQYSTGVRPILEIGNPNTNIVPNPNYESYFGRKSSLTVELDREELTDEQGAVIPRRGRGRPKGSGKVKPVVEVENGVKRGRGRPPLDPEVKMRRDAEKAMKPKRGRGRPKGSTKKPK